MDIYDEIFILWYSIFLNLTIHWHLEFRYSIELFLMCHYYIARSLACSFTFFIIFKKNAFFSSFTFFIIFEKNAFFNVLYSYFSHSIHLCWEEFQGNSRQIWLSRYPEPTIFFLQSWQSRASTLARLKPFICSYKNYMSYVIPSYVLNHFQTRSSVVGSYQG